MSNEINIKEGTFAEACYNMNSIEELENADIGAADKYDMIAWNLTPKEWLASINLALAALKADQE